MAQQTTGEVFDWQGFHVQVMQAGHTAPSWGDGEPRPRYAVTVTKDGVIYQTHAWGSLHDMDEGHYDRYSEMAAMVLDELASAYCDPDEFFNLAVGEDGRMPRERAKQLEAIIEQAQAVGEPLVDVANWLRDEGLL